MYVCGHPPVNVRRGGGVCALRLRLCVCVYVCALCAARPGAGGARLPTGSAAVYALRLRVCVGVILRRQGTVPVNVRGPFLRAGLARPGEMVASCDTV